MKTAVIDACAFGDELSLYETIAPFSAIAVEHSAVDVSMSIILSIVSDFSCPSSSPEKQVFQIWEYGICESFQGRV